MYKNLYKLFVKLPSSHSEKGNVKNLFFFCADKGEFRDRVGLRISLRPFSGLLTAKPARTANSCGIPKSAT